MVRGASPKPCDHGEAFGHVGSSPNISSENSYSDHPTLSGKSVGDAGSHKKPSRPFLLDLTLEVGLMVESEDVWEPSKAWRSIQQVPGT